MRFFVLADMEGNITDFFHAQKLIIYEKTMQWVPVDEVKIVNTQNMTRSEIENLSQNICTIIKEQDSEMLIGTEIVGIPYQILNKNGIIMCETDGISQNIFDEIYDDFYNTFEDEEVQVEDAPPYPVCVAEDGFYYFDFDKAMKVHPTLSSKKRLIPFLEQELYTCLTIRCSHIMPWLEYYTEQHGLSMDYKREDGVYIVNIMHGLCERVGEYNG
ncbi:Fe-only nitrogenase accessory AnfO family protein [Anaerosporobacter sp.]